MLRPPKPRRALALLLSLAIPPHVTASAQTPAVPPIVVPAFTGYAHPDPNAITRRDDGTVPRCSGELVFYLHAATAGMLAIRLERTGDAPATRLGARLDPNPPPPDVAGPRTEIDAPADATSIDLGSLQITTPGWHRLTLANTDGSPLRALRHLELRGEAATGLHTNLAERRNAASVHLAYDVPREQRDDVEWFYVELTPRRDPLWTYYMATGWHRGYFGMQVNSSTERRLIFSVWDAGSEAKDRAKVGADDRVTLVKKGEQVVASDFGNEGTGGHSHLVHDWQLGATFRFLLHARRDGDATIYSGWFWFAETKQWGLIASFRAPKDGKLPRGLYSFAENFSGANGDVARECEYGNAWIRTAAGQWQPLLQARFTHDGTGDRVRSDRWGGTRGGRFYLHHGGFTTAPDGAATVGRSELALPAPAGDHPADAELPTPPVAATKH